MENKPRSLFDAISNFPHNIGIYLTYTLDGKVIDKLTEHSTGTITILHDYRQGQSLNYNRNSSIINIPVKARSVHDRNCFHSKLVVLKNNNEAKIIIGSANLSKESFLLPEKEMVFEVVVKFDNPVLYGFYLTVINCLSELRQLVLFNGEVFDSVMQKLLIKGLEIKETKEFEFVYNDEKASIFDKVNSFVTKQRLTRKPTRVFIATPFVSQSYPTSSLKKWGANISFYLRNGSKIPAAFKDKRIFLANEKGRRKLFHSKIAVLQYDKVFVTYLGSANFTDQGFFKNTSQSANQENGVIFKSSTNLLEKWFEERYWNELVDIKGYEEESPNIVEFIEEPKIYAWAEKQNEKTVVYIYNPNNEAIRQNNRRIRCDRLENEFFVTDDLQTERQDETEVVKFKVGNIEMVIAVFQLEAFNNSCQKNESLFDIFKGIYSVDPKELDEIIEKERIKVDSGSKIVISEPPKLEQYFQNVKRQVKYIKSRKFFTEDNLVEINDRFSGASDIRLMYLAMQLMKAFKAMKNASHLEQACWNKTLDFADSFEIDKRHLKRFIKSWLFLKD
jgi:phosphatidylserine/phosphatidylglycerophosphate/cardiolipin synthase-like enzyme